MYYDVKVKIMTEQQKWTFCCPRGHDWIVIDYIRC